MSGKPRMKRPAARCACLALLLATTLAGCHLIFRYEDTPADAAAPPDKAGRDSASRKDLPWAPDFPGNPDKAQAKDKGVIRTIIPNKTMNTPSGTKDLLAIWGKSASEVHVVGEDATLLKWAGKSWDKISISSSGSDEDFTGVWGSGVGTYKLYISTSKGKVRTYEPGSGKWAVAHDGNEDLNGIHGSTGGTIQAVGEDGTLVHNPGGVWAKKDINITDDLNSLWSFPSGESFLVGNSGRVMCRFSIVGLGWTWLPKQIVSPCKWQALWGASASQVYAVGPSSCTTGLSSTSAGCGSFAFSPGTKADWYGIWGNSKDEIFLVGHNPASPGNAPIVRRVGTSGWSSHSRNVAGLASVTLRGVWGDDKGKLYIVGHDGVILEN